MVKASRTDRVCRWVSELMYLGSLALEVVIIGLFVLLTWWLFLLLGVINVGNVLLWWDLRRSSRYLAKPAYYDRFGLLGHA